MRFPVEARKDPRIKEIPTIGNFETLLKCCLVLTEMHLRPLYFASKLLCPHEWVEDSIYYTVLNCIDKDCAFDKSLSTDCISLALALNERSFCTFHGEKAVAMLKSLEHSVGFRSFLNSTKYYFYDNSSVWGGCGYEGTNGCNNFGERFGINDIDWLPEPSDIMGESLN